MAEPAKPSTVTGRALLAMAGYLDQQGMEHADRGDWQAARDAARKAECMRVSSAMARARRLR